MACTVSIRRIVILLALVFVTGSGIYAQEKDSIPSIPAIDSVAKQIADTMKSDGKKSSTKIHVADTVFLKNGDKITGKILSFEQGRLKIDAQGPGVVTIKWHKIVSISGGNTIFKIADLHGTLYFGYIQLSRNTGEIIVQGKNRYSVMLEDIVRLFPLEDEWYRGFKGNLGAGVSYTKSSEVLRINAEYNIYYVLSKWRFVNDFSFIETSTEQEDPSLRVEANLIALYSLPHKWLLSQFNAINRNDELGIKSRVSFGLGGGNSLIQTERQRLLFLTGILQNSEKDIESDKVETNFEWPFTIQHTIYSFENPNLSSSISATSYVGISETDRFRFDASLDLTWEFINNLDLQFSIYYNYDNKILEGKASQEDYGTVLSLLIELK